MINIKEFIHPDDAAALKTLKAIPGLIRGRDTSYHWTTSAYITL